jgi:O-antigen/teichoic acid export membrane protein
MSIKTNILRIAQHPLFKSSLVYTITDAINKAIPFLLLPILTHYLVPAQYGIATNFNVVVSMLTIFIGLGIQGAVSANYHKLSKEELANYVSNVLLIITVAFVLFTFIVFLLQGPIHNFIPIPLIYIIAASVTAYAQSISAINLTLWQLDDKPLKFGVYGLTLTALNVGLSLVFIVMFGMGWEGRVNGSIIASCVYGLFSLVLICKRNKFHIKIDKKYIRDALVFSLPLVPHGLSMWVRSGVDRVYITHFFGEAATGLYATGFQFGLLISFLTMAFNNAYIPYLYKNLSVEDPEQLILFKKKIVKFTYIYFVGLLLICAAMVIASFFMIKYFLSQKYIDTQAYIPWIMLSQVFQGMYFMVGNYVFFAKKTKKLAVITFACSMLQVIFSYFFIKSLGPIGAVYSTVIVSFVNFIAVWIYSSKVYDMPWFTFKKGS